MTTNSTADLRELDHRVSDGIDVRLLWRQHDNRVLVAVSGVLALAAIGRSFVQIVTKFDEAPLAYSLSALAAVVYVVATIALVRSGRGWYGVAWGTILFEFAVFRPIKAGVPNADARVIVKLSSGASLLLWSGVLILGRLIPFA